MLLGDYINNACVHALALLRPTHAAREAYLATLWADSSVDYEWTDSPDASRRHRVCTDAATDM